jgi:hypothetical protein
MTTRVTTRAENIETATPMVSVTPNPRTAPEAKKISSTAAITVVTLESTTAVNARSNPAPVAERAVRPAANSSFARSNTSTLASTAIPTASTNPAMPGRVRVAPIPTSAA